EVQNKVKFYLSVHRFEAAEKLIKAKLATLGNIAVLLNLLGIIYHRQSRFPEAITYFSKALKVNAQYVEAAVNLAATLCDLSRYDEANEVFAKLSEATGESDAKGNRVIPELIKGRIANQHAENGKLYEISGQTTQA